jgi:hypothetical protein
MWVWTGVTGITIDMAANTTQSWKSPKLRNFPVGALGTEVKVDPFALKEELPAGLMVVLLSFGTWSQRTCTTPLFSNKRTRSIKSPVCWRERLLINCSQFLKGLSDQILQNSSCPVWIGLYQTKDLWWFYRKFSEAPCFYFVITIFGVVNPYIFPKGRNVTKATPFQLGSNSRRPSGFGTNYSRLLDLIPYKSGLKETLRAEFPLYVW